MRVFWRVQFVKLNINFMAPDLKRFFQFANISTQSFRDDNNEDVFVHQVRNLQKGRQSDRES